MLTHKSLQQSKGRLLKKSTPILGAQSAQSPSHNGNKFTKKNTSDFFEIHFIKELITENPTNDLDEIEKALRDAQRIQVCVQKISTLQNCLKISHKKIWTIHPNQDEEEQALYITQISEVPTHYLVFTVNPRVHQYDIIH
ncbi:uncharacterized protein VP01_286g4 [Puccinia sorghi]|uniref:Uncharacterized protein n=1 Tax=Puccinia sorghi TaxID=27349 RepID=A0A0L6V3M5_9BASI|nr:uncharacterized protein VP01_286g4 [Puccinia sorghi]